MWDMRGMNPRSTFPREATMDLFFSQFLFRPEMRGAVGVEREYFLVGTDGAPSPAAMTFLDEVGDGAWTNELSACQVEHRTSPWFDPDALSENLRQGQDDGIHAATAIGLKLAACEVGPTDMSLDVYPSTRYVTIAATLPQETLRAACRVTGTHIHLGMKDLDEAIATHNRIRPHIERLSKLGDHSDGERLRLYKMMAPNWEPPHYESPEHFLEVARAQGFADNPRNCWHLVRISRHGTVELRMFGMTPDVDEIMEWVREVRRL